MSLTLDKLISGTAATLGGITGIDATKVHEFRREVRTEQDAARIWYSTTQGRIHAWNVTLAENMPVKSARGTGFSRTQSGQVMSDVGIVVEGVMGIHDAGASEREFRALCWTVVLTFNRIGLLVVANADASLSLDVGDVVHQEAMQFEKFGYLVLASMYSVHYARMGIRFSGQVSP